MRRLSLYVFALTLAPLAAFAQANGAPEQAAPTATLHASARLVVVDVTVTDGRGDPVKGLKPEDFHLLEDKKPQKIRSFEEHAGAVGRAAVAAEPTLQAGVFTNSLSPATDSPVNILLIDMLNTPPASQSFVHGQLMKFLQTARPGTRMAVFALTDRLLMLQGLTSDLTALRLAVERAHPEKSFRADPDQGTLGFEGAMAAGIEAGLAVSPEMVDALADFNDSEKQVEAGITVQVTLRGMNQLARYLAGVPGRKNLIWFSDSFPMIINPPLAGGTDRQTGQSRMSGSSRWADEYRETMDIFARSRVSIYPVDARGLTLHPRMSDGEFESRSTMMQMAEDTGGHAFFNTNGLAQAVEQVVDSGASYYTISYAPSNASAHGEYRNIRVQLDGDYQLAYRRGYFAEPEDGAPAQLASTTETFKSALLFTSPPATQIPFYAHLQPPAAPEPAEAEGVFTPASHAVSATGERRSLTPDRFLHYQVEFSADPRGFAVSTSSDGLRHSHVEYIVLVYDAHGKVVNSAVRGVQVTWTPAQFEGALQRGARYQVAVGVPASGAYSLRMMIHDMTNDKIGAIDVTPAEVAASR